MKNTNIPKDILPDFIEISERLWSGHATLMVGAGLSKNAIKNQETKKKFPIWTDLGDVFYEKSHGRKPVDIKYLNLLRIANEVEANFGRVVLEKLIKNEIPDKQYDPSELHSNILKLPWRDVFTTNYDTLLERSAEKIIEQRYETVVHKNELIYSSSPRIVKLHGCVNSNEPLTITEEDYRQYPQKNAPFVNTVQQSLLENTLCLIGFSGDDPNFLSWTGWIRDNLGKDNSPKMYLIGLDTFSKGQKRLLEDRNIIPINLSACINEKTNHEEALTFFMNFLHEQGKSKETINWPKRDDFFLINIQEELSLKALELYDSLKKLREQFPGWLVLPLENRDRLSDYILNNSSIIYQLKNLNFPLDINLLYEYNWITSKCFLPIFNSEINIYEDIINRYNPFPKKIKIKDSKDLNKNDSDAIYTRWIDLQLSMLRFYREEQFSEKWNLIANRIGDLKDFLNSDQQACYKYERCLYQLFSLDINSLKGELKDWFINVSLPYWQIKKAGLLAELGDLKGAKEIAENALQNIRKSLHLEPVTNNYSFVSKEAYSMQLLKYIKDAILINERHYTGIKEQALEYNERWNILKSYKCDPWEELKIFTIRLEKEPYSKKTKNVGYDLGYYKNTFNLSNDNNAIQAYAFLRYIDG
ncbi:MAG: SIR2 family NAD-dependent protein deacylase [Candidatus Cyclobacteriaceae bacterium M2_1C_046]